VRCGAVLERELERRVRFEVAAELDQAAHHVEADRRVVPELDRFLVLAECLDVLLVDEQGVALVEELLRRCLALVGDALRPW